MKRFIRGVRNLIEWAPIIWRDRDFDYGYLLKMLEFKLRRMDKMFRKDGLSVSSVELADEIRGCHEAMSRAINDDYCAQSWANFNDRWGEKVCPKCGEYFCKCYPVYGKDKDDIVAYKLGAEYQNAATQELRDQASKEFVSLCRHAEALKQSDIQTAFETIGIRLLWWWD